MRRIVVALAFIYAFGSAVSADEAKKDWKWDSKKKRAPVVGDRYFKLEEETQSTKAKISMAGQEPQNQEESGTIKFCVVHEILAVADGKVTKEKVSIERWASKRGDEEDKCLQGKTVVLEGAGEARTAKLEGGDEGVSEQGKMWIERNLKRSSADREEKILPKEPVAPDGDWTIAGKDLADDLKDMLEGAEIDLEKSSGKGKLTNVRFENGHHVGKVEIKISVKLKKFPGMPFEWTEGGVLEMTATREGSLESDKSRKGTAKVDGRLKGKIDQNTPDMGEIKVRLDVAFTDASEEGELGEGEKPPLKPEAEAPPKKEEPKKEEPKAEKKSD